MDAFAFVLLAHCQAAGADEGAVEGGGGVDTGWEDGDEVGEADAEGGVLGY